MRFPADTIFRSVLEILNLRFPLHLKYLREVMTPRTQRKMDATQQAVIIKPLIPPVNFNLHRVYDINCRRCIALITRAHVTHESTPRHSVPSVPSHLLLHEMGDVFVTHLESN